MLIEIGREETFETFTDLFNHTRELMFEVQNNGKQRTVVFGPITGNTQTQTDKNFRYIIHHSHTLARSGKWAILSIPSLQPHIDTLLQKMNINGYPQIILDELTLPLIYKKCFDVVHFRSTYHESFGAIQEHKAVCIMDIPRVYLP